MTNLLLDAEILAFILPLVFGFVLFAVILAVIITRVVKAAKLQNTSNQSTSQQSQGVTQHQRQYMDSLREKKYQRIVAEQAARKNVETDDHAHLSDEEERYDEIVGSLGDVSDEGCDELAGVRLIVHDLAYEQEDTERDYTEVAKAIVLGDVINHPRCKRPYKR